MCVMLDVENALHVGDTDLYVAREFDAWSDEPTQGIGIGISTERVGDDVVESRYNNTRLRVSQVDTLIEMLEGGLEGNIKGTALFLLDGGHTVSIATDWDNEGNPLADTSNAVVLTDAQVEDLVILATKAKNDQSLAVAA